MSGPVTDVGEQSRAASSAREERLVSVLARASGRLRVALSERWLFTIGATCAIGGIVLVIIGWVGASRTVLVAGQIPYVVSGGLLGLALVFLGGFLYFGHWLALLVAAGHERAQADRAEMARLRDGLDDLNRSFAALAEVLAADASTAARATNGRGRRTRPPVPAVGAGAVAGASGVALVATETGSMVHRAECPIVAGRDGLRAVPPDGGGLRPCGICHPAVVASR